MPTAGLPDVLYHVDGDLVPAMDATVSVRDRGFAYGDAAFETLRAYDGSIFAWDRHEARLRHTCEALGMADAIPDDVAERVDQTLAANDLAEAYVRLSVTRGVQPGKLSPDKSVDPTVVVTVEELPRGGLDGDPVWDGEAVVQTVGTRRVPTDAVPADIKTHNYLNGVLARLELRRATTDDHDPDEAILRDLDGNVAEGTASNVFLVEDGSLKTPAATGDLLPGITREIVLELAATEPFPVETGQYDLVDLRQADEAFLTNTTWEIRPVAVVDGMEVGGGPITDLLRRRFDELIEDTQY